MVSMDAVWLPYLLVLASSILESASLAAIRVEISTWMIQLIVEFIVKRRFNVQFSIRAHWVALRQRRCNRWLSTVLLNLQELLQSGTRTICRFIFAYAIERQWSRGSIRWL